MIAANDHRPALMVPPPGGWQLLALDSEITGPVTGLALGSRALVAVREGDDGKVRVFDGTCPHRGAHLGYGGKLTGARSIVCPFHGKRIGLGEGTGWLCVREHETIDCDGAIFVKLSDIPAPDHGFEQAIKDIASTHAIVSAMIGEVRVPPELIIENAFDISHFPTVHLVPRLTKPKVWLGDDGSLHVTTAFHTNEAPEWEAAAGEFTSSFHARAFNPYLVVSELSSDASAKFVITGAAPAPAGCTARIAIAVRSEEPDAAVRALIDGSKHSFLEDLQIWNNLDLSAPARLSPTDAPVMAFRAFCASFATPDAGPAAGTGGGNSASKLPDPLTAGGNGSR